MDFYKSNEKFGTDDDLKEFIAECHKRDIWVMTDIVYNHVGNCNINDIMDVSCIPEYNDLSYYHKYCPLNDFNDMNQLMNCWLSNLPDLDQSIPEVTKKLKDWAVWYI